jgi:catechol 2,3-dioxygenase-like lactoylglutathione lyase family enzyme
MIRFHHVNLGIPPGGVEAEAAFLTEVLGYSAATASGGLPAPAGAHWFEASDGSQVHLSEDPDHRAASRAHVAVVLGDQLQAVVTRLRSRGTEVQMPDQRTPPVAFCRDPAGNRWELRGD